MRPGTAPVALLVLAAALASCGGSPGPGDRAPVLRIYNWSDYIAPDTVARFEKETGIRVTYDVFDNNEVLEAKLLSGASGYDLVVPSAEFLGRQILAGVFQPLDRSKLTGYANLDPELMTLIRDWDAGNVHAVPYLWGTTGIGYNVAKVEAALGPGAPVDSLAILLEPANIRKLAGCGVAFLDAPREVFSAALKYLGEDPSSTDVRLYQEDARAVLERVRPWITYFHSSQYINDLANGEICIAFGWSGDILQAADRAAEAGNGVEIAYAVPREGALVWFDMLAIPADAENVDNAHRFIDFILRPEVIAGVTGYVKYANANRAANALIAPEILGNPGIYPPPAIRQRLYTNRVNPPRVDRAMTRAWTAVKTGR